jgi:hypothetical protein
MGREPCRRGKPCRSAFGADRIGRNALDASAARSQDADEALNGVTCPTGRTCAAIGASGLDVGILHPLGLSWDGSVRSIQIWSNPL